MNKGKMQRVASLNVKIENAGETLKGLNERLEKEVDTSKKEDIKGMIEYIKDYKEHYSTILERLEQL